MNSMATKTRYTPEDLLELHDAAGYELVDGQLVERPMSGLSSYVGGRLFHRMIGHCEPSGLGWVFPADAGYQCFPDDPNKVRKPDGSFIRRERLPDGPPEKGHIRIAPDLAAEVLSPNDLAYEIDLKIQEYFDAGVKLVWEVNPEMRSVTVHRADGSSSRLREDDELTGEDAIPGFRMKVAALFLPKPESAAT